jgi:sugar/nucleoside kinase (ribokinase family)
VKRVGVVGTMVWDTIYGRGAGPQPVEEWGGIAYALAGLDQALAAEWQIVPLIKVGRDLAQRANEFLAELSHRAPSARFIEVLEPNNRVTLHYESAARRTECLTGGVPPWTWAELGPMVRDLDAVYVNFCSGFELSIEAARALRHGYPGPIYADLHSLFLGMARHGMRVPQNLADPPGWFSCFDVVQVNEDEMHRLGADPMAVAATALGLGVRLLVVTLGDRGAVYFTRGELPMSPRRGTPSATIQTARLAPLRVVPDPDPTGCGDVFGATLAARLLSGDPIETAITRANEFGAQNAACRGAGAFLHHVKGGITVP